MEKYLTVFGNDISPYVNIASALFMVFTVFALIVRQYKKARDKLAELALEAETHATGLAKNLDQIVMQARTDTDRINALAYGKFSRVRQFGAENGDF